jgi:putative acetyltransferase
MTRIRVATERDRDDIRKIHLSAFPDAEREIVSTLAVDLLSDPSSSQITSLVAEADGSVVGHIAFSPLEIDNSECGHGYILAPLGVKPAFQNRQVGSKLILSGIERLTKMGVNILFVYGDPKYYGRFGFNADIASGYVPPYPLQYPFGWLAMILNDADVAEPGSISAGLKVTCVDALNDPALW